MNQNKMELIKVYGEFNSQSHWNKPIKIDFLPDASYVSLFDQNGYDLTELEKIYYEVNDNWSYHRNPYHASLRRVWYTHPGYYKLEGKHLATRKDFLFIDPYYPLQFIPTKKSGAVLNHSYLLERKGYTGEALEQLKRWANVEPMLHKLINIRPKWGLDFSIDYVDFRGNVFEIFHYEWDTFDYQDAIEMKNRVEKVIEDTNWDRAASELLNRKSEWINLPFFEQSDWKCNYFGLPKEQFKMVTWNI